MSALNNIEKIATRKAYGQAIVNEGKINSKLVVLDAEVGNSSFAGEFQKTFPDRFIECFIAEQNMVSVALGLSKRGKIPFASTFGAFFSRAFDQIRMAGYSQPNIKLVGSHCGVSIGEDGFSQMALEDIAMIRPVFNSVILYPSDATSTHKLVNVMVNSFGLQYLRTTRAVTPNLYQANQEFVIGGSVTHNLSNNQPKLSILSAGITLHNALQAQSELLKNGVDVEVVDVYSIKPLDVQCITKIVDQKRPILVVEDHYQEGGIFGAVSEIVASLGGQVYSQAVNKMPRSGTPEELMEYMQIDAKGIYNKVLNLLA